MAQDNNGRDLHVDQVLLEAMNAIAQQKGLEIVAAEPEQGQRNTSSSALFLRKNGETIPLEGHWETSAKFGNYLLIYPGPESPSEVSWEIIDGVLYHLTVEFSTRWGTIRDGGIEENLRDSKALRRIVDYLLASS